MVQAKDLERANTRPHLGLKAAVHHGVADGSMTIDQYFATTTTNKTLPSKLNHKGIHGVSPHTSDTVAKVGSSVGAEHATYQKHLLSGALHSEAQDNKKLQLTSDMVMTQSLKNPAALNNILTFEDSKDHLKNDADMLSNAQVIDNSNKSSSH